MPTPNSAKPSLIMSNVAPIAAPISNPLGPSTTHPRIPNCAVIGLPLMKSVTVAAPSKKSASASTPTSTASAIPVPSEPLPRLNSATIWLATAVIEDASSIVSRSLTAPAAVATRSMASLAASTFAASTRVMEAPSASISSPISCSPDLPKAKVLTRAAPSESNSLKARRTRSDCDPTCFIAPAISLNCSSGLSFARAKASRLSSLSASWASPVPCAASDNRRVILCKDISSVLVPTPVSSAAWRNA